MSRNLQDELDKTTEPPGSENSETWQPEPGDTLVGVLESYTTAKTQYGKRVIAHVKPDNGETLAVWLSTKVLRGAFDDQKPVPGDRLGIKRFEDHAKGYKLYTLIVEPGGIPFSGQFPNFDPDDEKPAYVSGGGGFPADGGRDDVPPPTDADLPF